MKKEAAIFAFYDLGCSTEEIDDLMHTEYLRLEKRKEMQKTSYNGNNKRYETMKTDEKRDEKRMDEDERKKERVMMEEGLFITVKEV